MEHQQTDRPTVVRQLWPKYHAGSNIYEQKIIENNAKIAKQAQKKLFKSFAGRLESGSPQDIFKKIYAPDRIGEIRELKKILIKHPEIYKAFQRNVLTDLNEKVMIRSNRLGMKILDPKAFDNYLNGL
ncbi:MAG: hypothetical protein ABGW65_02595 [Marinoscillum sp.]